MLLKHLVFIAAVGSLLFILGACGDTSPILIGFSGQLTGKTSDIGVFGRNGAMLAIEKINETGGINGRPLKLIAEDDGNTPDGALKADKILIDAGVVAIIGHMTSSQTMAALPFINKNGMVLISPTTSTPELTNKNDLFFRTMVENPIQSKVLADYARSALDFNTVVTVKESDNENYSFTFTDNFSKQFIELGGDVLKSITYSSSANTGWDPIIDSLITLKPDAILLTCPAHDAASIVQQIRNAGLKTRILSGAWAYTDKLLQWGGHSVEGMIFVIEYATDNPKPAFIKFRKSYRNRFGANPNFASALSYESVLALAKGLQITNGSASGLADAMAPSGIISGVVGDFKLNEYGDVERNVFLVTIKEGEFRTIEMR